MEEVIHHPRYNIAVIRLGRIDFVLHILAIMILGCTLILHRSLLTFVPVKLTGSFAQFFASILLVNENTTLSIYIPLTILTLTMAILEGLGGVAVWRA